MGAGRPKRTARKRATQAQWRELHGAKQGPCRVCQAPPNNHLHHVLSRAQGGSDDFSNLVPLCPECHRAVEAHEPVACRKLVESLDDHEYAYAVEHGGESVFERRYGVTYQEAT